MTHLAGVISGKIAKDVLPDVLAGAANDKGVKVSTPHSVSTGHCPEIADISQVSGLLQATLNIPFVHCHELLR
jgi:hypothetical protein